MFITNPTTIIIGNLSNNEFDTLWLSGGNSHTNHSDMTKGTSPESWTPRLGNRVYLRLIDLIAFFWRLLENKTISWHFFQWAYFNLKFKMQFGRFWTFAKNAKCNKNRIFALILSFYTNFERRSSPWPLVYIYYVTLSQILKQRFNKGSYSQAPLSQLSKYQVPFKKSYESWYAIFRSGKILMAF